LVERKIPFEEVPTKIVDELDAQVSIDTGVTPGH
jgi:hypothetical protein